ncbi:hypothetical protein COBT_000602 [Conglomerata obtusa]
MKKTDSKKLWLFSNLFFTTTYTLTLLPFIINIPHIIPTAFLTTSLIIAYASTLTKIIKNPKLLLSNSNFYCILIFLTFPPRLLLLPFYIISVTNICSFIVLHKKKYDRYSMYPYAVDIVQHQKELYIISYVMEILCVPISLVMCVLGRASLLTLMTYFYCVSYEYCHNPVMRKAFTRMRVGFDRTFDSIGFGNEYYKCGRDYIISKYAIKEETKKE